MFGIDQISVDNDVKDSAAPFDQIRFNTRRITNRVRQTGGLRGVVSLHAVGNADFHPESSVIRNIDCQNLTLPKLPPKVQQVCRTGQQCRAMIEFCRGIVSLCCFIACDSAWQLIPMRHPVTEKSHRVSNRCLDSSLAGAHARCSCRRQRRTSWRSHRHRAAINDRHMSRDVT